MAARFKEVEVKLAIGDLRRARAGLLRAGFTVLCPRSLERNVVFDTAALHLREQGRLLRLRQYGADFILTYKGSPRFGRHKTREELEITVDDPKVFGQILTKLGFEAVFQYEKYRTLFSDTRGIVALDETPIGDFLEIEGAPRWIDRTAERLGFDESDFILDSYGRLYLEYCERRGTTPGHMLFPKKSMSIQRKRKSPLAFT
ncbi:MAG: class IV adenylate cyclase [Blastocatellia bacterium]